MTKKGEDNLHPFLFSRCYTAPALSADRFDPVIVNYLYTVKIRVK